MSYDASLAPIPEADIVYHPNFKDFPASSFMIISATQGTGREGIDARMFRFGANLTF